MIKHITVLLNILLWSLLLGISPASSYTPIYTRSQGDTVTINVPTVFNGSTAKVWYSIGSFLNTSKYKVYVLNWKGYGGDVEIGQVFIDHMIKAEHQGKTIRINMIGDAYSMHSNVACYANTVKFNSYFMMFHVDSYINLFMSKDKIMDRRNSKITEMLDRCVAVHILNRDQIDKIYSGNEIYISNTKSWSTVDSRTSNEQ